MPDILDAIANPRPSGIINPLEQYAKYAGVANLLNENRRFQAQRAIGQAYQQATGPDGTVDPARAQALIAANPDAASGAQEATISNQGMRQAQTEFNTGQQQRIATTVGSALSLPDSQQNPQTYKALLDQELSAGTINQQHYTNALSHMPQTNNPADFRTYGTRMLVGALAGPQMAGLVTPGTETVNDGQSISGASVGAPLGPNPGAIRPTGTPVQVYPSRSDLASRTNVGVGPDGQPLQGPLSTVTPPNLAGPAGTAPAAFPNGGRLPPALRGPGAAPAAPNGGVVATGLGPAQAAAQSATGAAGAQAFNDITAQGVQAKGQSALLGNLLADAAQFETGPGQDKIKTAQATIQKYAPGLASAFGVKPESIAANESFDKIASQLADAQGAGSDARLAVNQNANPSSHLTPAGVDMIVRQLQGNSDYAQARSQAAAAYPDKSDRAGFESKIGAQLDPRVFQYARLTPDQKTTYFNSMTPADRAALKKGYAFATQNGLLGQ